MWKWKEDEKPAPSYQPPQPAPTTRAAAEPSPTTPMPKEVRPVEAPKPQDHAFRDVAHIGKSVVVKGELSGSEDLFVDGEVEGSIELRGHNLVVGPNGRVRASVHARDVIVHGKVNGNIHDAERVELKTSAVVLGDIFTKRIVIQDGAYFKGGIDIQKEAKPEPKPEVKPEPKREAAAAGPASVAAAAQAPLIETKK